MATYPTTKFTSHIAGESKCHLVESLLGSVVVLNLDAVVGVDTGSIRDIQIIVAQSVIV